MNLLLLQFSENCFRYNIIYWQVGVAFMAARQGDATGGGTGLNTNKFRTIKSIPCSEKVLNER